MAYLAVFQPDARAAARITSALAAAHRAVAFETWTDLERFLASEPVDGCVLDADHPSREDALAHISRLRGSHPHLTIVAFSDFEGEAVDLFKLGELGIDGVLLANPDFKPGRIRDAVGNALTLARTERVRRSLEGRYPPPATRAVAWAMEHAAESPTVATFAAAMGQSPGSLARTLRSAGLPAPGRLLLWGRLLLAGAYLARDGRTVEETAFRLGYSTASALSRAMKREIGHCPSEVADRGGLAFVQSRLFAKRKATPRKRWRSPTGSLHGAVLVGLVALQAVVPPSSAHPTMPDPDPHVIDSLLDAAPLSQVHFGVLAEDAATGRVLYARNTQQTFIPASNAKLLVAAPALELLGSDYRYQTALWGIGEVRGDTLQGSLVLVGTGDPTLSGDTWDSGEAAMQALADSLVGSGIRRVTGALVIDASAWDSTTVGHGWESSDLPESYAATGGAFALDEGALTLIATGLRPGEPARVTWRPKGTPDYVTVDVTSAPLDSATRVQAHYLPESHRLVLDGQVRSGGTDTLSFALRDPVRQAAAVLARALSERGVQVDDGWRVEWDRGVRLGGDCVTDSVAACPTARRLAALGSPPLSDIVTEMLADSQNWIAEQLIRTLGAQRGAWGSWKEGIGVVRSFLTEEVGIDSLDFGLRDGSGLSMHDLVTPRAIVHILRYMRTSPEAEVFRAALAEPGEEKSTLEHRLETLEGSLHAKTGTLSGVNALSGYVTGSGGREIVFSILSDGSNLPSDTVRDAIDDIVNILAR